MTKLPKSDNRRVLRAIHHSPQEHCRPNLHPFVVLPYGLKQGLKKHRNNASIDTTTGTNAIVLGIGIGIDLGIGLDVNPKQGPNHIPSRVPNPGVRVPEPLR
ncbi:hypothetical protein vseg_007486 [Gypsophila vaccaria]